jgi:exosortase/archaeosortase family protein
MKKDSLILDFSVRYLVLILVAIQGLWIFYFVFTPLTAYPVYWLLDLFYDAFLISGYIIMVNQSIPIELIEACIAGAAYYLLLILNLTTRGIKLEKRVKMIAFAFSSFLVINILRIFVLSIIAISGSSFFDITHKLFWYALSTIFIVAIWFAEVRIFKIKEIPFYSDLKFLYKKTGMNKR